MPNRTEIIHHIPTDQKQRLDKDYRAIGAISVYWTYEGDDMWTLTAIFRESKDPSAAGGGTD